MSLRPKIKTDDNGNILDLPIDAETISTFKPYINICTLEDNGTKTAGTWLAKTDKISSLVDGQLFLYKITVAGATTTTLNITGSSGTALGAHTIYRYGTTKLTTQYAVGQYLILVYNTTNTCFRVVNDYDANSYAYVRQYQFGENAAGETNKYPILTRYNLTNKHGSYDTAYSRFYTETYVDTSNGYLYAPKLFSGDSEVALKADIPTKTSELTNNSNFVVDASYVHTDNNFTTTYKNAVDANSDKVSNVQADWNATTGLAVILNKPTLATVATSGSYNDLANKPTIPTVDYPVTDVKVNGTSVVSNKIASITVPAAVTESTVAGWGFTKNNGTITGVKTTAGAHTTIDISSGKATFNVPTKTSHLTNDSGYLTAITSTDVTNALGYTPGTSNFTGYTSTNKLSTDYINNVAGWTSLTLGSTATTAAAGNHTHDFTPSGSVTLTPGTAPSATTRYLSASVGGSISNNTSSTSVISSVTLVGTYNPSDESLSLSVSTESKNVAALSHSHSVGSLTVSLSSNTTTGTGRVTYLSAFSAGTTPPSAASFTGDDGTTETPN